MSIIFIRAVILLLTLIVVMRLMGKRQIGEMEPFEFVITLLIAELVCVPMSDVSIPLLYGIVSVLAVFILHQLLTLIEKSGRSMRKLISGKPSIVINKNGIDIEELKSNNMSVDDLLESLRGTGNFSFDSVYYAVFEANGKLSVMKNDNVESENLPLLLVAEGKYIKNNLKFLKISEDYVENLVRERGVDNIKNVIALTIDETGKTYLQKKDTPFEIFNTQIGGSNG